MTDLWNAHKALAICLCASVAGLFPLLGLPGVVLLSVYDKVLALFGGRAGWDSGNYGDAGWPIALVYSVMLPWLAFGCYQLVRLVLARPPSAVFASSLGAALALLLIAHLLFVYPIAKARALAAQERSAFDRTPAGLRAAIEMQVGLLAGSEHNTVSGNLARHVEFKQGFYFDDLLQQIAQCRAQSGCGLGKDSLQQLATIESGLQSIRSNPQLQTEEAVLTQSEWASVRAAAQAWQAQARPVSQSVAQVASQPQITPWFQRPCRSVSVAYYPTAADTAASRVLDLGVGPVAGHVLQLLSQLPPRGDILRKIAATTPRTKLTLDCGDGRHEINFYGDRVQTPDSSFFSAGSAAESALIALLQQVRLS